MAEKINETQSKRVSTLLDIKRWLFLLRKVESNFLNKVVGLPQVFARRTQVRCFLVLLTIMAIWFSVSVMRASETCHNGIVAFGKLSLPAPRANGSSRLALLETF